MYKENTDEQQVTLHKDSTWQTQWQEWRDNSVLMQRMFDAKKGFDESDSLFARATRSIGERITGSFGQMFSETETATALREITKIDPSFSEDAFLDDVERRIIPTVLEAFVQGDLPTLKDWCHEGVATGCFFFSFCAFSLVFFLIALSLVLVIVGRAHSSVSLFVIMSFFHSLH